MKTQMNVLWITIATMVLVQCKSKKETATTSAPAAKNEIAKGDPQKTLDIDNSYVWPGSTDPFRILSAQVSSEDSLIVEVEYGGGCKDHVFRLVTNGMMKKSMPPQCTLYLEHESNDDMCRAMLRQKVAFFIGSLAKNNETIVIHIHDYTPETGKLVLNPAK